MRRPQMQRFVFFYSLLQIKTNHHKLKSEKNEHILMCTRLILHVLTSKRITFHYSIPMISVIRFRFCCCSSVKISDIIKRSW